MAQYIDKNALVAEIERIKKEDYYNIHDEDDGFVRNALDKVLSSIDTLEVKEVDNMPNISFPQYKSIVEKVFGAGNLESWEYSEAEQLVLLAKEELLKDLEVKKVNLEKVFLDEYSKFSNDVDAMDYAFPIDLADYKDFAKHFFELGIKVQKGE